MVSTPPPLLSGCNTQQMSSFQSSEGVESSYILALVEHHDDSFSVHGLWPDPWVHRGGTPVALDMLALKPLLSELQKYWFSTGHTNKWLWGHEWQEHGRFAHHLEAAKHMRYTQYGYFSQALFLYKRALRRGEHWIRSHHSVQEPWGREYRIRLNSAMDFVD